jgi:cardiolipin synthase A/B
MFRRASLLLILGFAAACSAATGVTDDSASGESDLTGGESAAIDLVTQATKSLTVTVSAKTSSKLADAVVAAAARGVPTRAIVVDGAFDATWTLQQHLESSGVDTDVRAVSPAPTVLAIADGTALVVSGSKVTRETGGDAVGGFSKKFDDVLGNGGPARPGALVAAGTVKVLPMPDSGDGRLAELFATAQRSIDLSIYALQERRMVGALVAAAARGVAVRVMLEPRTVGASNFGAMSAELTAGGVKVMATPPAFDIHHNVDHAKFCIVDDAELLYGTGNMVKSSIGGVSLAPYQLRDFWIEDGRPASVAAARALFEADVAHEDTSALDMSALVLSPDNADAKITSLVDGAKHRLFVYNQSLSDPDLVARLVKAKARGVDVHVLLGYQPGFGGAPPAGDATLAQLRAGGVTAAYLRAHYLHAKAIVADDQAYLGSQNFTNGGLRTNRELGEIFDDADLVETVAATFQKDESAP